MEIRDMEEIKEIKEIVQSVERALQIMECFTKGKSELVLGELPR
jgi:DNA-binding IscR family transcriptional regulator